MERRLNARRRAGYRLSAGTAIDLLRAPGTPS